jgi:glycosyltransferase involved in cell wall biosynthesis
MSQVAVIVPTRNAAATLDRALRALAAQELDRPYEVVVVDNGSSDRSFEIAAGFGPPVRAVRNSPPSGPGAARNAGVMATDARALAFTDADCFPTRRWLAEGLAALAEAELVQGAVRPDPAVEAGPFDRTVWVTAETGLYETANLLVRRQLFERVGGFEDWLPAGERPIGEDLWFGWRARRSGASTAFCESAVVHHAVFPRGAAGYVAERARLVHFPRIAERIPELRRTFFYRRWFLNRRSASFDAAVLAALAALLRSSPLPLLLAAPYATQLAGRAAAWRRRALAVGAADLAADALGLAALAAGSARSRRPLL